MAMIGVAVLSSSCALVSHMEGFLERSLGATCPHKKTSARLLPGGRVVMASKKLATFAQAVCVLFCRWTRVLIWAALGFELGFFARALRQWRCHLMPSSYNDARQVNCRTYLQTCPLTQPARGRNYINCTIKSNYDFFEPFACDTGLPGDLAANQFCADYLEQFCDTVCPLCENKPASDLSAAAADDEAVLKKDSAANDPGQDGSATAAGLDAAAADLDPEQSWEESRAAFLEAESGKDSEASSVSGYDDDEDSLSDEDSDGYQSPRGGGSVYGDDNDEEEEGVVASQGLLVDRVPLTPSADQGRLKFADLYDLEQQDYHDSVPVETATQSPVEQRAPPVRKFSRPKKNRRRLGAIATGHGGWSWDRDTPRGRPRRPSTLRLDVAAAALASSAFDTSSAGSSRTSVGLWPQEAAAPDTTLRDAEAMDLSEGDTVSGPSSQRGTQTSEVLLESYEKLIAQAQDILQAALKEDGRILATENPDLVLTGVGLEPLCDSSVDESRSSRFAGDSEDVLDLVYGTLDPTCRILRIPVSPFGATGPYDTALQKAIEDLITKKHVPILDNRKLMGKDLLGKELRKNKTWSIKTTEGQSRSDYYMVAHNKEP
ncbi:hypothetical protein GNI_031100 [Gregarina niphandrodes]|uniref:Uncharacterized protein n=1 Tax=Gregarina niphandrodes TaxID=110365 RepID=A0A023BAZ1_GRENI|nr:hypothetical protein GNI_031100 [Gregarina niphandrodes]EZG78939.1 hypothetical protein GNI_031100 [Gregarina niphandrodes]|eukprot:XP_011129162.1 hypothetical protein GNI_031100 [Gregarina niphandrodes]